MSERSAGGPGIVPTFHRSARWLISPVVVLVLWQALSLAGLLPPRLLASPLTIAATLWNLAASGQLLQHLLVSLGRVLAGFAIALVIGVSLALTSGLSRLGEAAVDPLMQMLRALPFLGVVPLLILWFGIGEAPKIILVVLGAVFPIYLTLLAGIRGVDARLVEMARTLHLSRGAIVRDVVLPGALPSLLVGIRYGFGVAWLSLVVGEQVNADRGIGFLITNARDFFRNDVIVAALIVYAVLGLLTDALVRMLERRLLAWRPALTGVSS